jgi:tetratricopeptide (TPR) repeat protein
VSRQLLLAIVLSLSLAPLCAAQTTKPSEPAYGAGAPSRLFDGLGSHQRTISTTSPEAQQFFNQGLNWMYAFNHDEAVRAFTRAAELDPQCAMAWWGVSQCQGPNYNSPEMSEARSAAAWDALQRARARIDNTTPVERALIEALGQRYAQPEPEDRTRLDQAYADALAKVWEQFPDDSDVGTLYAEAMMVQHPWKLYTLDREPVRDDTLKIVATLERVITMDPYNPGANHLYIHAVEPSADKARAVAAADRLSILVPASGHLRHMPAHIYVQVGMWERSIEQNDKALQADKAYLELSPRQRTQYGYMAHNAHMLAFSAMMAGREKEAMAAARRMWEVLPEEVLRAAAVKVDITMSCVYDVQKRFGRWDEILAEPAPPPYLPITTAVWRAHRAIAYAAKKDIHNAQREHEAFRQAKAVIPEDLKAGRADLAHTVLQVSDCFIAGEIALQQGQWDRAAELLEEGAKIEDTLSYREPPGWLQPIRHTLGAVYLSAGKYQDAERVYREDLAKWPDNGWSLYGLSRALEGQGKTDEAQRIMKEYQRVWANADEPTRTSCKCIPQT